MEDGAGIWLDTKVGALFNVSNPHTLNSPGCPSITVYMTQMRDMLVSRDVVAQTLHAVNLEISEDTIGSIQYLSHQSGRRISKLEANVGRKEGWLHMGEGTGLL